MKQQTDMNHGRLVAQDQVRKQNLLQKSQLVRVYVSSSHEENKEEFSKETFCLFFFLSFCVVSVSVPVRVSTEMQNESFSKRAGDRKDDFAFYHSSAGKAERMTISR